MADTNTLAPCPFCGERAETDFIPEHHSYQIACSDSIGCTARITRDSELGAIEAWNCRAALAAPAQPVGALAAKAAVHDAVEAAAIQFISRLTGMAPPPLECAPPEVTAPFKQFADEVMAAIGAAAPQPPAQAQEDARKPLTDDQILSALDADIAEMQNAKQDAESWAVIVKMTRAIEAAHGIAAQQGGQ